jgi:hypothetical protein
VTLNNPVAVTDGDYWANSGSEYASTTSGLQSLQVDLEAKYRVDKIKVWHYANNGRTYHNTKSGRPISALPETKSHGKVHGSTQTTNDNTCSAALALTCQHPAAGKNKALA